jgi:hypothetical protein
LGESLWVFHGGRFPNDDERLVFRWEQNSVGTVPSGAFQYVGWINVAGDVLRSYVVMGNVHVPPNGGGINR